MTFLAEGAVWMAFAIFLVSWPMTAATPLACATSFVIEIVCFVTACVSWLIRMACCDTRTARCAVVAVVRVVSTMSLTSSCIVVRVCIVV